MTRLIASLITAACLAASPALADLDEGAPAPAFAANGYLAGQPMQFDLAAALAEGPVVAYFFPAAFTPGCNIEASLFAEAADEFAARGATLIGLTQGNIDRLAEFSEKHCASKFPVAAVDDATVQAYDAVLREGYSTRTSYVIAADGTVALSYTDSNPNEHVSQTLAALDALSGE